MHPAMGYATQIAINHPMIEMAPLASARDTNARKRAERERSEQISKHQKVVDKQHKAYHKSLDQSRERSAKMNKERQAVIYRVRRISIFSLCL